MITTEQVCECGNAIDFPNETACDYCLCNEPAPESIRFYSAHFGGHGVAECTLCNFKSVSWDCACSLEHDCNEYQN
jgi:hypothetical protein